MLGKEEYQTGILCVVVVVVVWNDDVCGLCRRLMRKTCVLYVTPMHKLPSLFLANTSLAGILHFSLLSVLFCFCFLNGRH